MFFKMENAGDVPLWVLSAGTGCEAGIRHVLSSVYWDPAVTGRELRTSHNVRLGTKSASTNQVSFSNVTEGISSDPDTVSIHLKAACCSNMIWSLSS